jgi:hypothetical protein
MNTCENCKHWDGTNMARSHRCNLPSSNYIATVAYTLPDMSCPRFDAKPEIPAKLREWKPVWHTMSDKSGVYKNIMVRDLVGHASVMFWNGDEYIMSSCQDGIGISFVPAFWTELP